MSVLPLISIQPNKQQMIQLPLIAISGSCIICCLFGCIEINGKTLTEENNEDFHDLVSFKGSTLLGMSWIN